MSLQIAVDAMGGDYGPASTMPAILSQAKLNPDIRFLVFGHKAFCASDLPTDNIEFRHVEQSIGMDDIPTHALRNGRQSSMAMSLKAVQQGEAEACITAGNTGALVALSRHILGLYAGIDRPALCKVMPTHLGRSYMLDLGATINCSADQLVQFARLGSALFTKNKFTKNKEHQIKNQSKSGNNTAPSVRLLNIGSEHFKGMDTIRLAAQRLAAMTSLQFEGYIQGDAIYKGETDIIVCDGFVGNIALKTSEGVAHFMLDSLKERFRQYIEAGVSGRSEVALPLHQSLKQWQAECDPARYNGAQLLGVKGTVIKSHGGVSEQAFACALDTLVMALKQCSNHDFESLLARFAN